LEASNTGISDEAQLVYASGQGMTMLTYNAQHFFPSGMRNRGVCWNDGRGEMKTMDKRWQQSRQQEQSPWGVCAASRATPHGGGALGLDSAFFL
jgi:hypothetical protein